MDPLPILDPRQVVKSMTVRYVIALSLVALLAISGQFLIRTVYSSQKDDAELINIAGRQRMFSQRNAKLALLAYHSDSAQQRIEYAAQLERGLQVWSDVHHGLQSGDEALGLPGDSSPEIQELFAEIELPFRVLSQQTRLLVTHFLTGAPASSLDAPNLEEILLHEADFLKGMDAIVRQYSDEASGRVEDAAWLETLLLIALLFTLVLEVLFIFKPAVSCVKESLLSQQENENRLKEQNEKLNEACLEAEAATRAKAAFLSNMSHEFEPR